MPVTSFLTICCLSDLHALHRDLEVPPADIVIIAGDFTFFDGSPAVVRDFNLFLGELKTKHKPLVIFGNHEMGFEANPARRELLYNGHVLLNESITLEGLKVWGSPVTTHHGGAFAMPNPADRKKLFRSIPEDVDIIITHGPPDIPGQTNGDPVLLDRVMEVKPLVHVFGHEHSGYGTQTVGETLFVNCSLLGRGGGIENPPILLRLSRL